MAQSESTKRIMKKNLAELKKMRIANDKEMLKHLSDAEKKFNKLKEKLKQTKPAVVKRVAKKSLAKRLVGKVGAKAIPGVGAAIVAHDVMRAGAKKGCIKRGGKWVKGKCQGVTKSKSVTSGKDPRFAKSRSKK